MSRVGTLPLSNQAASGAYRYTILAPVYASDGVHGYCLLLRGSSQAEQEISAVEEVAVAQGASAAALEWAKQNAVGIAEERMRATFLDELLAAEIADEQAWIRRGSSLNYDLTKPHVAVLADASGMPDWPAPLMRFMQQRQVMAPHTRRDEGILFFWPVESPKSGREFKSIAGEFVEQIQARNSRARLIIGIGRPGVGPANWLQSLQQARESWRLGKEWETAPVTYFGDLGLYQLLTGLSTNPEAARFYRKTLGKLISHDDNKNSELVQTLDAFFACHGNLEPDGHAAAHPSQHADLPAGADRQHHAAGSRRPRRALFAAAGAQAAPRVEVEACQLRRLPACGCGSGAPWRRCRSPACRTSGGCDSCCGR